MIRFAIGILGVMLGVILMPGALLTSWTIRAALVCYALYVALALATDRPRLARAVWTAGCALFISHVACAFHFYHHWSHQAAWQATARETQLLLGVPFGDGIYFSYLFLVLWVCDVAWLWTLGRQSNGGLKIASPLRVAARIYGPHGVQPLCRAVQAEPQGHPDGGWRFTDSCYLSR